eukprot:SAG11_NODE_1358_length_5120_cov_1.838080_7_plen_208_part_00
MGAGVIAFADQARTAWRVISAIWPCCSVHQGTGRLLVRDVGRPTLIEGKGVRFESELCPGDKIRLRPVRVFVPVSPGLDVLVDFVFPHCCRCCAELTPARRQELWLPGDQFAGPIRGLGGEGGREARLRGFVRACTSFGITVFRCPQVTLNLLRNNMQDAGPAETRNWQTRRVTAVWGAQCAELDSPFDAYLDGGNGCSFEVPPNRT